MYICSLLNLIFIVVSCLSIWGGFILRYKKIRGKESVVIRKRSIWIGIMIKLARYYVI